ncbi:MAG: MOSC domain-containing protein [Nitrospira defluvii]|nr:MOSC domain-containing protein [Nitrospira defluvii]
MTTGRIRSIQIGLPRSENSDNATDQAPRPWTSGIFKCPVLGPIWLGQRNLQGDGQADLLHHGGLDKAVCAYSAEHWPYWQTILPPDQLYGGAFGENFTLEQLREEDVCIGDVFSVGTAVVQISQPRQPCWKLARRWHIEDLAVQVERTGFTGWYFRVLQEGRVEVHQQLQLLDRPCPEWTVAAANRIMHHERNDQAAAERLSLCPFLSLSWQQSLRQRALNQAEPNPKRRQFEDTHP